MKQQNIGFTLMIAVIALALTSGEVRCQDSAPSPAVVERYEQMLLASPQKGTAFNKVYNHYLENEGLEKLLGRWQKEAQINSANRFSYLMLQGLLAERMDRTDEARKTYREAAELNDQSARPWIAIGELEAAEGKMKEAISAFEKAMAFDPGPQEKPAIFRNLARAQQRDLQNDAALDTWMKMAREYPEDIFVLEEVGEALLDAEKFTEAKKIYEQLKISAGNDSYRKIMAAMRIAFVEERQGKYPEALKILEGALEQTSDTSWIHREVRSQIEQIYRRQDDLPGLIQYYQKWLEFHPEDITAALRLSEAFMESNRKTDAIEWLQKAAEKAPERKEIRVQLARRLIETSQAEKALEVISQLTGSSPDELAYWEILGDAHWQKYETGKSEDDRNAAIRAWRKIAPENSRDASQVERLAEVFRQHRLSDEAVQEYRRALELNPSANEVRERLAGFLVEIDRKEDARKVVAGLVEGERRLAENYVRLANWMQQLGDISSALNAIDQGISLDSRSFDLLALKWRILIQEKKWAEAASLLDPLLENAPNDYFADEVENRYVEVLRSMGTLESTQADYSARLGSDRPLSAKELRLLTRMAFQTGDMETAAKAVDDARKRFPESVVFARLQAQLYKRTGEPEKQIAALKQMMELQPKLKIETTKELIRVCQENGLWDQGLDWAKKLIEMSPAQAEGYLQYANLCFTAERFEEGVAKLREAVRLSENPNQIRLRMAQAYLERGDAGSARQIYDEAFEAEEDPARRISMMKGMAEAYFLDQKLEELLDRMKQRQKADEEGWRYSVYLAEIYQQIVDYGAAQKELSKALAIKPKDKGLVQQLIKLASAEGNQMEVARHRKLLLELEPTASHRIEYVQALLNSNEPQEALQLIRQNAQDFLNQPRALQELLHKVKQLGITAQIGEIFVEDLKAHPENWKSRFSLAQLQMVQGQLAEAQQTLWAVFRLKEEMLPISQPAPSSAQTQVFGGFWGYLARSPYFKRMQNTWQVQHQAQQLLNTNPHYYSGGISVAPASLKEAQDHALIYLAAIATQGNAAEEFLKELDQQLTLKNSPSDERIVVFNMVQSRHHILTALEQYIQEKPNEELDLYLMQILQMFIVQNPGQPTNAGEKEKAEKIRKVVEERVARKKPEFLSLTKSTEMYQLLQQGKKEEARALARSLVESLEDKNDDTLMSAFQFSLVAGDIAVIERLTDRIIEVSRKPGKSGIQQQLTWMPFNVLNQYQKEKEYVQKMTPVLGKLIRATYPSQRPSQSMVSRTQNYWENVFPPSNRFFQSHQIQNYKNMAGLLKEAGMIEEFQNELKAHESSLKDSLKIYPQLLQICFLWWMEKYEEALESTRELVALENDEELRQMLAAMLAQQQRYKEAVEVLETSRIRFGEEYRKNQVAVLKFSKMGKDMETARKAALRLAGLRLPYDQQRMLIEDLRELGLTQKAEEFSKSGTRIGSLKNRMDNASEVLQLHLEQKNTKEATALARSILAQDPEIALKQNNQYTRQYALSVLLQLNELQSYVKELEADYEKSPDSIRLNLLLAEANSISDGSDTRAIGQKVELQLPIFLRLERNGNEVSTSYSRDGKEWSSYVKSVLNVTNAASIGVAVLSHNNEMLAKATFDEIVMVDSGQTNQYSTTDGAAISTPWKVTTVGADTKKGDYHAEATEVIISGGGHDIWRTKDGFEYFHRPLNGDGSLTIRLRHVEKVHRWTKVGIMLRQTLGDDSANGFLCFTPDHGLYYSQRSGNGRKAMRYQSRLAELKPDDWDFKRNLARIFAEQKFHEEALKIYDSMLLKDPVKAIGNDYWMILQAYRDAKQLSRLGDLLMKWEIKEPQGYNPYGYQMHTWQVFQEVGEYYAGLKQVEQAVAIWKKGQKANPQMIASETVIPITKLLHREGRTLEAVEEIRAFFFPPQSTNQTSQTLGFYQHNPSANWAQTIYYSYEGVQMPALKLLKLAHELNALSTLISEAERVLKGNPQSIEAETLILFGRLMQRDAGILTELQTRLEQQKFKTFHYANTLKLMMAMQMTQWPEARPFAAKILQDSVAGKGVQSSPHDENYQLQALLKLAAALHEEKTVLSVLKESVKKLREQLVMMQQQSYLEENVIFSVLQGLVEYHLNEDLFSLVDLVKEHPRFKGNDYSLQQMSGYFRHAAILRGEVSDAGASVWLDAMDPQTRQVSIKWELCATNKLSRNQSWLEVVSIGKNAPILDERFDVEIHFGRTTNDFQQIAVVPKAPFQGTWKGVLPSTSGYLKAVTFKSGQKDPVSNGTPIYVSTAENLIPSLILESSSSDLKKNVPGWSNLPVANCRMMKGGPGSAGSYVEYLGDSDTHQTESVGPRIPVKPGTSYLISAWTRYGSNFNQANLLVRCLDSNGAVLKTTTTSRANIPGVWTFGYARLTTGGTDEFAEESIPEKTAYLEPVLYCPTQSGWSNLYVGAVE